MILTVFGNRRARSSLTLHHRQTIRLRQEELLLAAGRKGTTAQYLQILAFFASHIYLQIHLFFLINRLQRTEESKKPEANPKTGNFNFKSDERAERRKEVGVLTDVSLHVRVTL